MSVDLAKERTGFIVIPTVEQQQCHSMPAATSTLFLSGEPDTARLILRDLVNATVGFERLAELTHKPRKSLHRMLSPKGNPSMDNLAVIFGAVKNSMKFNFDVRVIEVA